MNGEGRADEMVQKPLDKVRVIDLSNVLAGPFCCNQLAHMGADVIKVERPGSGDLARQLGADPELNARKMGVSFLAQNAGKRSITVDLKNDSGKAVLRRLAATADVLVENFRPGVMDRLGLGFNDLIRRNRKLIYCAITGFGQEGPLAKRPAYDQIIQGMSGIMSITGDSESAPLRAGYPVADTMGGMTAAFAIAAQLAHRPRQGPCFLDVSMLDSVLASMGWVVSNYLATGREPRPMGNSNFTASPSGTFRTGDGLINIAANKQQHFIALCRVLDREELATDPRFDRRQARLEHRTELGAELESALALKTSAQWCALLNGAGVPAGEVLGVAEALALPQVKERGLIEHFEEVPGVVGPVACAGAGFRIDDRPARVDVPPPVLGGETRQILKEIGFDQREIARLEQEKAI
jgi:crotonobetainyl-CoA:carnitine CoA-transferase CaiB-like acyl-CoA transferase